MVALLAIVASGVAAIAPAAGQPNPLRLAPEVPLPTVPTGPVDPLSLPSAAAQGPATVFIELAETPAVEVYQAQRGAGQSAAAARRGRTRSQKRGGAGR